MSTNNDFLHISHRNKGPVATHGHSTSPVTDGSSSRDRLQKRMERYNNMSNHKKEELLLRNREYKRHSKLNIEGPAQTPLPTTCTGVQK